MISDTFRHLSTSHPNRLHVEKFFLCTRLKIVTFRKIWDVFESSFECPRCQKLNKRRTNPLRFCSITNVDKTCEYCREFSCRNENKLYRHMLLKHFSIFYYWCNCRVCDCNIDKELDVNRITYSVKSPRTRQKDNRFRYMKDEFSYNCTSNRTKQGRNFRCEPYCSYKSKSKFLLRVQRHLEENNLHFDYTNALKFCTVCGFKTNKLSKLNKHFEERHIAKELKLKKTVINSADLDACLPIKKNIRKVSTRNITNKEIFRGETVAIIYNKKQESVYFKCGHCSFVARKASQLKRHLKSKHEVEKPDQEKETYVECEQCYYVAKKESHLKGHVMSKHENKNVKQRYFQRSKADVWECHKCTYKSKNKNNIFQHLFQPHRCKFLTIVKKTVQ